MSNPAELIHSMRNPLNTISVNAELGKLTLQKNLNPEAALRAFNEILNQCELCAKALEELAEGLKEEE